MEDSQLSQLRMVGSRLPMEARGQGRVGIFLRLAGISQGQAGFRLRRVGSRRVGFRRPRVGRGLVPVGIRRRQERKPLRVDIRRHQGATRAVMGFRRPRALHRRRVSLSCLDQSPRPPTRSLPELTRPVVATSSP